MLLLANASSLLVWVSDLLRAGEPTGHSGLVLIPASFNFVKRRRVGSVPRLVFSATKKERKSIGCDLH